MTTLLLYDDACARTFEPFALTRPASELRAGALLVRERWERAVGVRASGAVAAPHLADFEDVGAPGVASGVISAGTVVANARCVPALAPLASGAAVWRCGGRAAAVCLARDLPVTELADGSRTLEELAPRDAPAADLRGRWLNAVWDLLALLGDQLTDDILALGRELEPARSAAGTIQMGEHPLFVERGAVVEPLACFDTTAGPVLIRREARVHAFTRVVGPCYIGEHSTVIGDRIAGSSIGEHCKVHGELSTTVFLGYSNKSHDGFVGHSVLGRWSNLGAGTITSNLKNTYGPVQLWTPRGVRDTGLQFLGTLLGDHAKTGIGTRLTTGAVVGAGANVFGGAVCPKVVPPFAWGERPPYETYRADKFVAVAERVMARRQVTLTERGRRYLSAVHAARWSAS